MARITLCLPLTAAGPPDFVDGLRLPAPFRRFRQRESSKHIMVIKDYRTEIGAKQSRKSVPKAVAIAVFAAVAVVIAFSVTQVVEAGKKRHAAKHPAAAAPAD